MMKHKLFLSILVFCHLMYATVPGFAQGQQLSTASKKAEKFFLDALDHYNGKLYDQALKALDKATETDPRFIEAYVLKGDIYSDEQLYPQAIDNYRRALSIDPDFSPQLYYIIANLELSIGLYNEAKREYLKYLQYRNTPSDKQTKSWNNIKACDFAIRLMGNPVPFNPVNLGDSVNTGNDEYVNAITSDDQKLYFTRKIPRWQGIEQQDRSSEYNEDFYCSVRKDSLWRMALSLGNPVNTFGNEGALSISPDGQFLFFAACNRDDGYGSCDLYWARKDGYYWTVPVNLGEIVNSPQWDSQPTFSSNGKTLYFASKRKGGKGSSDLWKTELQPDMTWSEPMNLGDSINSVLEEMAPFIHPDDQTIYFSSRGHQGMGGLDLFYSRKDELGNWKVPVNIGYPINTFADEITLVVNSGGDLAYFSSDKFGGKGKQDVYSFVLYPEARPVKATYMKGIVYDKETKKRLEARFELIDLASGNTIVRSSSDPVNGEFLLSLPTEKDYALNVSKDEYLFYSDHFELKGTNSKAKPLIKDIPLQQIRIGESIILKNIFFDTDKYDLKQESRAELEKLTGFLNTNKMIRIEISGHTDNQGTPEHNLVLSKNRARAVYEFLVQHGIKAERLAYTGFGITKPIDTNETEQGRANNRRTEFRIVSK